VGGDARIKAAAKHGQHASVFGSPRCARLCGRSGFVARSTMKCCLNRLRLLRSYAIHHCLGRCRSLQHTPHSRRHGRCSVIGIAHTPYSSPLEKETGYTPYPHTECVGGMVLYRKRDAHTQPAKGPSKQPFASPVAHQRVSGCIHTHIRRPIKHTLCWCVTLLYCATYNTVSTTNVKTSTAYQHVSCSLC
jgi:hypothetical protein